ESLSQRLAVDVVELVVADEVSSLSEHTHEGLALLLLLGRHGTRDQFLARVQDRDAVRQLVLPDSVLETVDDAQRNDRYRATDKRSQYQGEKIRLVRFGRHDLVEVVEPVIENLPRLDHVLL